LPAYSKRACASGSDSIAACSFGSTLATILLSKEITIVQGVTGLVILVLLQFVVTWLSVRSDVFSGLVKAKPTLLF